MKYLLDTNVLKEMGKTRPHENVRAWLATVNDVDLAISALTVREVAKGVAKLRSAKPDVAEELAASAESIHREGTDGVGLETWIAKARKGTLCIART